MAHRPDGESVVSAEFTRLPGASVVSCIQLRPFTGSASNWRVSMLPPMLDCCTSTSGAAPVTVTVSSSVEIVMVKSITTVWPTSISTDSWSCVANPVSSAVTSYTPVRNAPMR